MRSLNISRHRLREFVKHLSSLPTTIAALSRCLLALLACVNWCLEEECCCCSKFAWKWVIAIDYMRRRTRTAAITLLVACLNQPRLARCMVMSCLNSLLLLLLALVYRLLYGYQTRTLAAASFQIGFFFSFFFFLLFFFLLCFSWWLECAESLRIDCAGSSFVYVHLTGWCNLPLT